METPVTDSTTHHNGWRMQVVESTASTNDLARNLPPWSMIRCGVQHFGRGRFNRPWIGEAGGLWASFTLPLGEEAGQAKSPLNWGHLPLVAGLALLGCLESLGVHQGRLRWPNDLLVEDAKLAGILVERPSATMAVVGIGMNTHNDISTLRGIVKDTPARLADLIAPCPTLAALSCALADALRTRFEQFQRGGLAALLTDLSRAWKRQGRVLLETDGEHIVGTFMGIDAVGNPIITEETGTLRVIDALCINRLVEV